MSDKKAAFLIALSCISSVFFGITCPYMVLKIVLFAMAAFLAFVLWLFIKPDKKPESKWKAADVAASAENIGHKRSETVSPQKEKTEGSKEKLIQEKSILLERCRKGDNKAMLALSKLSDTRLANMWLVRAVIYGNEEARAILREDPKRASNTLLPMKNFIPGQRRLWFAGSYDAAALKEAGFDELPDYAGSYIVAGLSEERVMVIGIETGYEPADEDGFGMEIYYDYYVYDEFFHRISETAYEDDPGRAYGFGAEYIKTHNTLPNLRIDWLMEDGIV